MAGLLSFLSVMIGNSSVHLAIMAKNTYPPRPLKAVIDLGTNTFHLLVARMLPQGNIETVYRERIFVKLAAEGIATIGPAPFTRGLQAMNHFKKKLDEYKCNQVTAVGTAALRRATNGTDFITSVQADTGIEIQLISGQQEATLITKGVLAALPPQRERILIMDIGGGSTEYIIVEGETLLFRQSFPIGVSVLHNQFHHTDPMSVKEQQYLMEHLREVTEPLAAALRQYPTHHLAGAAGTFDVLADLLQDSSAPKHPTSRQLSLRQFPELRDRIIGATYAERNRLPGIPVERVDMIVVAMLLLTFTFDLADVSRVTVSDWAMKEGILLGS